MQSHVKTFRNQPLWQRITPGRRAFHHSPTRHSPPPSIDRLVGKKCFITGGSRGIGLAIAHRFLLEGASKIVLVGRNKQTLEGAARDLEISIQGVRNAFDASPIDGVAFNERIRSFKSTLESAQDKTSPIDPQEDRKDKPIHFLTADVSNDHFWDGVRRHKVMEDIDILVNAAGVAQRGLLPFYPTDAINNLMATNLFAPIMACRTLVNSAIRIKDRGRSHSRCIINVSSLLGMKGGAGASVYAATKAGLLGLTRALAEEVGTEKNNLRIRVNAIVPGYIETAMMKDASESLRQTALESIPLGRFGTPEEVADAAVFLAANQYANNCTLNLDGGLSAT